MKVTLPLLLACMCASLTASAAPMASLPYQRSLTREARAVWGLDAPVAAMAGQIEQESAWNATAQSAYAQGLAQFTPSTAAWISGAFPKTLGAGQPFNPEWAIRALAQYDDWLGVRVVARGDCDWWAMILSSYNGGLGWLARDKLICEAQASACDPSLWFGNVELYTRRSAAAARENRGYPRVILLVRQHHYADWGRTVSCSDYPAYRPS